MTPNQLVAANLIAAREELNLTQAEAADLIQPYLGERWSKAAFSARERSIDGTRIREFTADEVMAMAMAFNRPIGWFFLPMVPREGTALPEVDPSGGRGGYDAILACETVIQLVSSSKSIVDRLTKLLAHDSELRRLSFNPRARPMPSQVAEAIIELIAAFADASEELKTLFVRGEASEDDTGVASTSVQGDNVGYRTLVALADEVIEIGTRLEAVESALGIGERKDDPDARSHSEEG